MPFFLGCIQAKSEICQFPLVTFVCILKNKNVPWLYVSVRNILFLKNRKNRDQTVSLLGHKIHRNYGWSFFNEVFKRTIGQFHDNTNLPALINAICNLNIIGLFDLSKMIAT